MHDAATTAETTPGTAEAVTAESGTSTPETSAAPSTIDDTATAPQPSASPTDGGRGFFSTCKHYWLDTDWNGNPT